MPPALLALVASLSLIGSWPFPAAGATPMDEPFVLRVPVLTFHRVTCPEPDAAIPELRICPERFRAQMAALKDAGWSTVTADELAQAFRDRTDLPMRSFVITVDDGIDDGYHQIAPILAELEMTATFYIVAGKTPPCDEAERRLRMTWCEVRELRDAGHDIGNHTLNHERVAALSDEQVIREVEEAQDIFAQELGARPTTFAYPYGEYDERSIAALEASDLILAFTFHGPGGPPGDWADDAHVGEDRPFESERITIYPTDEPEAIVAKLEPFASGR